VTQGKRRHWTPTDAEIAASKPTRLRPGSAEKIELLTLRWSLGLPMHIPGDLNLRLDLRYDFNSCSNDPVLLPFSGHG